MNRTHDCPVCRSEVAHIGRYPEQVCGDCAAKATDENGRKISFMTLSFAGGLTARFDDSGERYTGVFCYIEGRRCRAEEDRFGRGIVIQIVKD